MFNSVMVHAINLYAFIEMAVMRLVFVEAIRNVFWSVERSLKYVLFFANRVYRYIKVTLTYYLDNHICN